MPVKLALGLCTHYSAEFTA